MKTKIVLSFLIILLVSCNGNNNVDSSNMSNDSIALNDKQNALNLRMTEGAMAEIAECLDSIAIQEQKLIERNAEINVKSASKKQILENIKQFADILASQRQRLIALQDSLSKQNSANAHILQIISYLNKQLEEKDAYIAQLSKEVLSGKRDIVSLTQRVTDLSTANSELNETNQVLTQVANAQEKAINRGFFIIGTSKDLKNAGVVTGGILKKNTVNAAGIDKENFIAIDIRKTTEISVTGNSPKILSQMPADSYHWKEGTLVIDNPSLFWSVTQYLVIQVK